MFGLFNSKKSTSNVENKTETNIQDRRIGAGDGAMVAAEGGQINIQTLDADVAVAAINSSAGLASKVSGDVTDVAKEAIATSAESFKETIDFAERSNYGTQEILNEQTNKNRQFIGETFKEVAQAQLSEEERQSQQLFILGVVFLAGLTAIFITRELKGRK